MRINKKNCWSYHEAQKWVIEHKIKSKRQLVAYIKAHGRPPQFPARPDTFYDEWDSWGEFLHTHTISSHGYTGYEECRLFAKTLNMKSKIDWERFVKSGQKPKNIPSEPRLSYLGKGWVSWSDFLGYRRGASYGEVILSRILSDSKIEYRHQFSINECADKAPLKFDFGIIKNDSVLGLIEFHGQQHYFPVEHWGGTAYLSETQKKDLIKREYCKKMSIPLLIVKYDEIQNAAQILMHFFEHSIPGGNITIKSNYCLNVKAYEPWISYDECKQLAQSLGVKSGKAWRQWCSKNPEVNVPRYPDHTYSSVGWKNWFEFLGKSRIALPNVSEES